MLDFLEELRERGIRLWAEDGSLRFRAAKGAMTPQLRGRLKEHKEELLELLQRLSRSADEPALEALPRHGFPQAFPVSFAQERLFFLDRLEPGNPAYNLPQVVRLRGDLRPPALARALSAIVERHEALRTRFEERQGQPVQLVESPSPVTLPVVDLSPLETVRDGSAASSSAAAGAERFARALAARETQRPFDLSTGPLLRALLLRLGSRHHLLVVNMHHIVSDGWSLGVMVRELSALYTADVEGGAGDGLPALRIQYPDISAWQRRWLQGEVLDSRIEHWRRVLDGAPQTLELPADRPREASSSARGQVLSFRLEQALTARLRAWVEAQPATLFMTLLATFGALLSRLGCGSDLVIGTPVANRSRAAFEPLIGFFVNTLPLRLRVSRGDSFADLVEHGRRVALDAFAHQDLPFEKMVEALAPDRGLSSSPLVQVLLALQNAPVPALELPQLTLEPLAADAERSKFDLSLFFLEDSASLTGWFQYSVERFDDASVALLRDRFLRLLQGALEHPEGALAELPLMSEGERLQLLVEWNDTDRRRDPRSLHQLVWNRSREAPEAVALAHPGGELTYLQLVRGAAALATVLAQRGVGSRGERPEAPVGIALERSAASVQTALAVLATGAPFLPLDPALPSARLAYMIRRAGCRAVVVRRGGELPDADCAQWCWEQLEASSLELRQAAPELPAVVDPRRLAYVLFTSGSSGRPKGVAVPHRSVVQRLSWGQEVAPLTSDDRVLQGAGLGFDFSLWEIFAPLAHGATVVLPAPDAHQDAAALLRVLEQERITVAHFVPAMLALLVGREELPTAASALRLLYSGGEVLPPALRDRVLERLPAVELHNQYGPTEATVDVTFHRCRRGDATVPIGRPAPGVRAYVVDTDGRPMPAGCPGELLLGGTLARGYIGAPALTAAAFRPDALSRGATSAGELDGGGRRLYGSGDRGRWNHRGELEYLGRLDAQVKIRGIRIEPGEIEAVLLEHPDVHQAVVQPWTVAGDQRLAAWVSPATLNSEALRQHLGESLPAFMVPSAVVLLEALPLTPAGKVDRRALPQPRVEGSAEAGSLVSPRTTTEEMVARVWAEVLGVESLGVHDDFFDLGGHSLLAIQLLSRVRDLTSVEVPLKELFEAPTVAGLATRVELLRQQDRPAPPPFEARAAGDDEVGAPLSFAQERLWFAEQLRPDVALYNTSRAGTLEGPLEIRRLARTLGIIVARHEVLRSRYEEGPDGPRQIPQESQRVFPLPCVDLRGLGPEAGRREAQRLANREARRPVDLERGPVVRAVLMKLDGGLHGLALTIHHIAYDLWSGGVLLGELAEAYTALGEGREPELAQLPVQYGDFADWQRRWLQGEALASEVEWWRQRLGGLGSAPLELPYDRPRREAAGLQGNALVLRVEEPLAQAAEAYGRRRGVTQFMTLLAVFKLLLHRVTGQRDLVVGTPISNRDRVELENLIGFFDNLLALRLAVPREPTFDDLVDGVRDVSLEAYGHPQLPFESLVNALGLPREGGRTPLVQAVFLHLLNYPAMERTLAGLKVKPFWLDRALSKFDLTLSFRRLPGGLTGELEYNVGLFDGATAQRLLNHYHRLLAQAVESPQAPLSRLSGLSAAERHQLLREWSSAADEGSGFGAGLPVPLRVLRWAEEHPEAAALVDAGGQVWSYGALARRARSLAQRFAALGVTAETPVAFCGQRRGEQVVAYLAVWLAGGAYLPLDSAYPDARLELMVRDSGAIAVVVDEEQERRFAALEGFAEIEVLRLDALGADYSLEGESTPRAPSAAAAVGGFDAARWHPLSLAYVIYTSGSTGRPKGVEVSQGALANLVDWHHRAFGVTAQDRASHLAGQAFDASVWEIWPYLAAGACVYLPAEEIRADPPALRDWLLDREITITFLPTPLAEAVLGIPWPDAVALRLMLTGGDRLSRAAGEDLPFPLINNYGPTENAVVATSGPVPRHLDEAGAPDIGRMIDGVAGELVNAAGRLAPLGAIAELTLAGASLARGYLGRPALTAEAFRPAPESFVPGVRRYHTGDLVRHDGEGRLLFLGRRDQQVQVRGFRVELGEVEAAILEHDEVAAAVVKPASPDGPLAAWVVPEEGVGEADWSLDLRRDLERRLPDYMVPAALVLLDSLPLTPNGKVDRDALPDPGAIESADGYAAPRNPTEELVADIWKGVLAVPRVGVHDNFFELGGHSLLATQVASRIRQSFDVDLSLLEFFSVPTVAAVAKALDQRRHGGALHRESPIPRRLQADSADELQPLSFAQERLWFIDRLDPGSSAYNVPAPLLLRGPLDERRLVRSLAAVVQRHEVLRTTFDGGEGEPRQRVGRRADVSMPRIDLTRLGARSATAQARRLAAAEQSRPFDLQRGPVLRCCLLNLGTDEAGQELRVLLLTLHHIVSDGWSMGVLLREMATLYQALAAEPAPPLAEMLPPLPIQYRDYALWQRRRLSGEILEGEIEHWRQRLEGGSALRLLQALPGTEAVDGGFAGRSLEVRWPLDLSLGLAALGRREGASLFMVLLAAFQLTLARWSDTDDVAVGTPIAGRNRADLEPLVGFFINLLVLRSELERQAGFQRLLTTVRRRTLEAYDHQDLPFEKLVDALRPKGGGRDQQLFEALFSLQNAPMPRLEVEGLEMAAFDPKQSAQLESTKFPLALTLGADDEGRLQGVMTYDQNRLETSTAERLLASLQRVAAAALADPQLPIAQLPLLDAAERHQLEVHRPPRDEAGAARWSPLGLWPGTADSIAADSSAADSSAADSSVGGSWGDEEAARRGELERQLAAQRRRLDRRLERLDSVQRELFLRRLRGEAEVPTPSPSRGASASTESPSAGGEVAVTLRRGAAEGEAELWLVHPIGGGVFSYRALAQALPAGPAVHAIQAAGLEGDGAPRSSIEAMADAYGELIRGRETRPIHLAGWSFGAQVAFEMARRWAASGWPPLSLTLLDALPPGASPGSREELSEIDLARSFFLDAARLQGARSDALHGIGQDFDGLLKPASGVRGLPSEAFAELVAAGHRRGLLPQELGPRRLERHFRVYVAHRQAASARRPGAEIEPAPSPHLGVYEGAADLILSSQLDAAAAEACVQGWRRRVADLTTITLPGDHYELLQSPQVEIVAARLAHTLGLVVEEVGR
ncbi:MAG: amino acid adenylation domain-containing protein [Acidobacteriota bacterium]